LNFIFDTRAVTAFDVAVIIITAFDSELEFREFETKILKYITYLPRTQFETGFLLAASGVTTVYRNNFYVMCNFFIV